ncbi:MAG: M3 family oligoendopeptidase [Nitrospirota bacterium]
MKQILWNLSPLLLHDDDPQAEKKKNAVERESAHFIRKWRKRDDYLQNPSSLKQALDDYERWRRLYGSDGDPGYYFWLRMSQEQNNASLRAKFNTIDYFSRKILNDMQFFHLRLSKIPFREQRIFLRHPELGMYRHFLARIFAEARYLLSDPEERIMNLKSSTSYSNWVRMTSSFLAKEERSVLLEDGTRRRKSFSDILSLMNSRKKRVRDIAARAFNEILASHADVAEAEINSVLENKKVDDDIRKIPRPDLARHISDDIETEVVDTLVESVSARFSLSQRYYAFKARLLNVRQIEYHERNVEYGDIPGKFTFPVSIKLIRTVLKRLDGNFLDILDGLIRNGQFDVYPRKGKTSGAFCSHQLISQPTYILLNHTDRLNDVLTLAHELGHGINNELIRERQHALNFGTPTSTAEVASTFLEDFVLEEILTGADDARKLAIMVKKLNDDVSTIFRQIACYRFEQELHRIFREKGYLSREEIGGIFRKNMNAYMGKAVAQSPGSENWWIYWSHIRSFFYVYSYASGLLISKSLQRSVKENPRFIEKVKHFLGAGLSESPRAIFRRMGIDITDRAFWDQGLNEIGRLLDQTIALARKLGKLR